MVLWPLSTPLKHCLIPPLSTDIHPYFTLFPFFFCLPLHPYLPLWLPLSRYSSITLSSLHPSFDLCPYSRPYIHDGVYKALNLRDYLYRFPLLYFPPLMPPLLSIALFQTFLCTICTLFLLLPTPHFLSLHLSRLSIPQWIIPQS